MATPIDENSRVALAEMLREREREQGRTSQVPPFVVPADTPALAEPDVGEERSGASPQGGGGRSPQAPSAAVGRSHSDQSADSPPEDPAGGVKVTFVNEGESVELPDSPGASTLVVAHVVGNHLLGTIGRKRGSTTYTKRGPQEVSVSLVDDTEPPTAEIELLHPELGPLRLSLEIHGERVALVAKVNDPRGAALLREAESLLRTALKAIGLTLGQYAVQGQTARSQGAGSVGGTTRLVDETA